MIDGCSRFCGFWQIILPVVRPAMITVAIFPFQGAWNDFAWLRVRIASRRAGE